MIIFPKNLESMLGSISHSSKIPDTQFSFKFDMQTQFDELTVNLCYRIAEKIQANYNPPIPGECSWSDSVDNLVADDHSPVHEAALNIVRHLLKRPPYTGEMFVDMFMADGIVFDLYHNGNGFNPKLALVNYFLNPFNNIGKPERGWGMFKLMFTKGIEASFSEDGRHTYIRADKSHLMEEFDFPYMSAVEIRLKKKESSEYSVRKKDLPNTLHVNPKPRPNFLDMFKYLYYAKP